MAVVKTAPKVPSASRQRQRQRHRDNRGAALKGIAPTTATAKHLIQQCFDYEQKQNRSWLGNQITQPNSNGISKWQHAELLAYFRAPTLKERARPPLLKEGLKLSNVSKEHLARLDSERNAEKAAKGLAPTMATRVPNWWTPPKIANQKPPGKKESTRARKLREFIEKKQREAAAAVQVETRKTTKKLRAAGGDEMLAEDEEEEGGVSIVGAGADGRWGAELPIRGAEEGGVI